MEPNEIPFEEIVKALLDAETTFNPRFLYRLSDLEQANLEKLKTIWPQIPTWRRQAMMEDIEDLGLKDTLLYYLPLAIFATQDEDAKVRRTAVQTLWEYEDDELAPIFLNLMHSDEDYEVRSAAALGLGSYVYLGEIEEFPEKKLHEIEDALLAVVNSSQPDIVRRTALAALGFSSRAEVPQLIKNAYASQEQKWLASALKAMGRSCSEEWKGEVLAMIEHARPIVRTEAARAAGELEIKEAKLPLIELLYDPDEDTRVASIWALSQIGGEEIQDIYEEMIGETEDEDEIEIIEAAIDNLIFNQSLMLPLFDINDEEMDDRADDLIQDFDGDF
ncbi:HEAT repeat domain-containing protein [Chloroflexota bacterium]